MMKMLHRLGILWWLVKIEHSEIYDSKTVISTFQIYAMLDYGKDCFRKICKGIKINKSCCYI